MLGYFLNHTCDTNVSELRRNKRLSVRNIVALLRLEGCDTIDLRYPKVAFRLERGQLLTAALFVGNASSPTGSASPRTS